MWVTTLAIKFTSTDQLAINMRRITWFLLILMFLLLVTISGIYITFGGGATGFPDRSSAPIQRWAEVELVANVDTPPGNIAVSKQGRIFLSQHPEARPEWKIVELKNGTAFAYPNEQTQAQWHTPLGIRIDQQQRLLILDAAEHGLKPVTLMAYDLKTNQRTHQFSFHSSIMGLGSHANDLQVSSDGKTIYIADASIFSAKPAIIIYDIETQFARRVLSEHHSVIGDKYTPVVHG